MRAAVGKNHTAFHDSVPPRKCLFFTTAFLSIPPMEKKRRLSDPLTYFLPLWYFLSAATLYLVISFTRRLLDPFYPFFIGRNPAIVVVLMGVSLLTAVVIVTFSHCTTLINAGAWAALLQAAAVFLTVVCALTFSLIYGSDFVKEQYIRQVYTKGVSKCADTAICEQFKQTIGEAVDLLPSVEAYVDDRTAGIGKPLAAVLLCWLVCHSFVVYGVFGGTSRGKKEVLRQSDLSIPPFVIEESDSSSES
jgi:hypothetical protein